MKALLLNPPRYNGIPVIREDRCENPDRDCVHPPTSLVYLAGFLSSEGHKVELVDANAEDLGWSEVERKIIKADPDWIVYRTTPATFYADAKATSIAKKYSIKTMLLCRNLYNELFRVMSELPSLDAYVTDFFYEKIITNLIENFDDVEGAININIRGNYGRYEVPNPRWDLVKNFGLFYTRTKFLSPWAVVRGSKGCPYCCRFCIDAETGWYPRSPELIADELEYLVKERKVPYVSFFDNTFEVNADWCMRIADEIERRKLKFKWYINSRVDLVCKHGLKFFKRLYDVGLRGTSLGVEFGSNEMLKKSGKGTTVEQGEKAIKILHKAKVKTYVSCMIGYLDENKQQMQQTVDFIKKTKPTGFQINNVVPYNGTELYFEAVERKLFDPEKIDWRGLSCVPTDKVPAKLSKLSVGDLMKFREKAYREIYFSGWVTSNVLRLRSLDDVKMGIGYFLSRLSRLKERITYAH